MTLAAGTRLGAYEILSPLGSGGMGEVYRARDSKLDRDVAIKVLPEAVANDPEALARFEREAKAVAALSHPNILAIHDFGRQGSIAYAVTELLQGETLRSRIDAGPIPPRQAIDYGLQIAKGLSAAHERGIVHRDLKPENVFVTKDGHVKILDFGIAKRLDPAVAGKETSAPTGSGQTAPGTVMGTLGYMSPEQIKGQPIDHRTDIFSFGAMLFEMLSGARAFKRDTSAETIVAILTQEPPELTGSGRNIAPAFDHVVRHCLEKDPGNRFQSAKDVSFALGEASGATTLTTGVYPVAVAPSSRAKKAASLIALIVVAAALGVIFLARRPHRGAGGVAGGAKRIAVLPFENLGAAEDDYFADGMSDEVRGKLTSLSGVQVIARGSSTPYKKTTKTPKQIAEELHVEYLLTATVRSETSGGTRRVHVSPELVDVSQPDAPTSKWQQRFDAALTDVFQVQSDIASQVAQALGVALGASEEKQLAERPTKSLPAYEAFLKGEEVSAAVAKSDPPSLRKALGFYDEAVTLDPGFALAWSRVASAACLLYSNSTPSPEMAERGRQAAEKAITLAPKDPQSFRGMSNYKRLVLGDLRGAQEVILKARDLAPENPDIIRSLGVIEISLDHMDAALEQLRKAERLDPRSVSVQNWKVFALLSLRRYSEARQAVDAGLALSPDNLSLIENRAQTYLGEGDLLRARSYLAALPDSIDPTELVAYLANYQDLGWVLTEEQKDFLLRLTPAAFDDDRGTWAMCLTQIFWWRGDVAAARKYAEETRKTAEEQLRATPNDPGRHAVLGLALAYLGRGDDAIREAKRALELSPVEKDLALGSYWLHQLVRVYILAGQPEKAIDSLERLLKIHYYVSPAWLTIDPNFDPLRGNPRFQKLVAGGK